MQLKGFTLLALAWCASAQQLTDVLAKQSSLSNLTSLLALFPNLLGELASASQITLLAPNDDAFSKSGKNSSAMMALKTNDSALASTVLSYHILEGSHSNFTMPMFVPTLLSSSMYANVTGGQVVEGQNTTFFSGLLQESKIVTGPLKFSGGVVYIVDSVLTFPEMITSTILDLNLTAGAGALMKAGLNVTLDNMMDVTVFMPSNAAFSAVDAAIANVSMAELAVIMEYHVVSGSVDYSTMLSNMSLPTLQGENVTITVEANGDVFVNSAQVIISDILVANGVVHVIDNVLNPANPTAKPNPTASTQALVFPVPTSSTMATSAASEMTHSATGATVSSVPFTSGVPKATTTVATSGIGATSTAAGPRQTGAIAAAALFGGAAVMMNI